MPRNLEVFPAFALEYGGAPKQLKADENLVFFFVCQVWETKGHELKSGFYIHIMSIHFISMYFQFIFRSDLAHIYCTDKWRFQFISSYFQLISLPARPAPKKSEDKYIRISIHISLIIHFQLFFLCSHNFDSYQPTFNSEFPGKARQEGPGHNREPPE